MMTMMVNVCDDDCYLVMKVILVKEVMSCDVSPVAMFFNSIWKNLHLTGNFYTGTACGACDKYEV